VRSQLLVPHFFVWLVSRPFLESLRTVFCIILIWLWWIADIAPAPRGQHLVAGSATAHSAAEDLQEGRSGRHRGTWRLTPRHQIAQRTPTNDSVGHPRHFSQVGRVS